MALKLDGLKEKTIERTVEAARGKLSGGKATAAEVFVRHFYENVAVDDLVTEEAGDLYGAALSLWEFAATRRPGESRIRVYNPQFDRHGWQSPHTVVEVVHDDMPFLVDSLTTEFNRQGIAIHQIVHPAFATARGENGKITSLSPIGKARNGAIRESCIHVQIDAQPNSAALKKIESRLRKVLDDVRFAVDDWQPMRQLLSDEVARLNADPPSLPGKEVAEATAFLSWLLDNHFTFLGYRRLRFSGSGKRARMEIAADSGLGVLRNPEVPLFEGLRNLGAQSPEVRAFVHRPDLLQITKATVRATVHRGVHMDTVAIKLFDGRGKVTGQHLFAGLFTSLAYSQTPADIPLLRDKVNAVVRNSGFSAGSHDGKALIHVLEEYPRDELFQSTVEELSAAAHAIVRLQERPRTALFLRRDPYERIVSALVYLPRELVSTAHRRRFETILAKAFNGSVRASYTHVTDAALGRFLFIVKTTPGAIPDFDAKDIEARLAEAARSWEDRLNQALVESRGEARGRQLFKKYRDAFPVGYREGHDPRIAVSDIAHIEETLATGALGMNLYRPAGAANNALGLKIYQTSDPIPLSDILPPLENMGLKVMSEIPAEVTPAGETGATHVHDFGLVTGNGAAVDIAKIRDAFQDSFARVWIGETEDDGFNRLVLRAGLDWREVVILRAYCKYLLQARIPFSQAYMEATLAAYPDLVRLLVRLFKLRFDPDFTGDRDGLEERLLAAIDQELNRVVNLDEDRILRRFRNLIQATLRTNYFQNGEDGGPKPYLSLKFDCSRIDALPRPRPMLEISVYSPRFEAVHMRFGKVARGGLRWSDRREDFRTEILGLVKAQQVKNAVIIPVGSKGGFVLKQAPPPSDREAFQEEGVECYAMFMRAMLDITDNIADGAIAPPGRVIRKDGDDPYLVVAADKGTATFSDIANEIALSYGFWLGDAFASGGSAGYDHKKMAITARGAWESVKRHFREMGRDSQTEPFTVVGCGDMSGDVFGNGMLLSDQIKLVGAFNHAHIFIDPDPDPAASFAERKRLFDMPRGGWGEYDPKLIAKGGGLFERGAKSIALTPQIRKLFDIEEEALPPNALIATMLRAEVDLLWFGGIGTYVKASGEFDAAAGDRANDALRVDANALRCKVIGEGANLGMTQRARIEYARGGGRLNSDSIDNSAGVDCSDHEVNIKIVLGGAVQQGAMTQKQRDRQLAAMTGEVAALCLEDNYAQTQAITLIETQAHRLLDRHQRLMRSLERAGILDRNIEFLPDDDAIDTLDSTGQGLTRPEIAVLFAYAKNATYSELLRSDLPDDPMLAEDLARYFPAPLRAKHAEAIGNHTLRREIIATSVTNSMLNRTGPSFISEMRDRSGMEAPEIARAYMVVREVFALRPLWAEIEALDNIASSAAQTEMLREINRTVHRTTQWFLRNAGHPLDITALLAAYAPGIETLAQRMDDILQPGQCCDVAQRTERFAGPGIPEALARRIGGLKMLSTACDIIRISGAMMLKPADVARTYFALGDRFRLDWLRRGANRLTPDSAWHKLALEAIIDDLWATQSALSAQVLEGANGCAQPIQSWAAPRGEPLQRVERLIGEIEAAGQIDLAMLTVANRALRDLAEETPPLSKT